MSRRGQAIVESLVVLLFLLGATFFFYDFASGLVARLLLDNAAANVARADAVGFNDFHQAKALRVGMIPISGRRTVPDGERAVAGAAGERALVRTYLQAADWAEADGILDYERWDGLSHTVRHGDKQSRVTATFEIPSTLPWRLGALLGVVPAAETRTLRTEWPIEDHASLWLVR